MLAAAGKLDLARPDGSPAMELQGRSSCRTTARRPGASGRGRRASRHRSVYLPLLRGLTPTLARGLRFRRAGMVTGSRDTTTVAAQALYLLNDPFVRRQSLAWPSGCSTQPSSTTPTGSTWPTGWRSAGRRRRPRSERATEYLADYDVADATVDSRTRAEPTAGDRLPQDAVRPKRRPAEPRSSRRRRSNPRRGPHRVEAPVDEDVVRAADARDRRLGQLLPGLLGTAEFRYVQVIDVLR